MAVLDIAEEVAAKLECKPISSGSSKGLFEIEGASAEEVENKVREKASNEILQHATVMVAACLKVEGAFARQLAELNGRIRWNQMQAPSVVYPPLKGELVCDIDRVRPAVPRNDLAEKRNQSDFTYARRKQGREKKTELLQDLLGPQAGDFDAVEDLNELAEDDGRFGNLGRKLAVLRFDGNNFGQVAEKCDTEARYRLFAKTTKEQQSGYFRTLLAREEWKTASRKRKPLIEIVVYGGDEVTLITPAWLGWKALTTFYQEARKWPPLKLAKDEELTYSAGMVFCHCNAPIHAVKQLASELADQAKDKAREELGAKGNFAAYQVLESFDSVGQELEGFLDQRYQHTGRRGAFLGLKEMEMLERNMDDWHATLSRRKLHATVKNLMKGEGEDLEKTIKLLVESKNTDTTRVAGTLRELHAVLGNAAFLHILELWDYAGVAV